MKQLGILALGAEAKTATGRRLADSGRAAQLVAPERDFLQATLDSLSAHMAVLDQNGEIVMTNSAWARFAGANGGTPPGPGDNYLDACDAAVGDPYAERAAAGLRAIIAGSERPFALEYPCHSPAEERWFLLRATRFAGAGGARVVVAHEDDRAPSGGGRAGDAGRAPGARRRGRDRD